MNQTHTNPLKEARKKRHEYLMKLAAIRSLGIIGASLAVICGIALLAALCLTFWFSKGSLELVFYLGFPAGYAVIALLGFHLPSYCKRRSRALPYVPPVAQQLAALPAEEILVRG